MSNKFMFAVSLLKWRSNYGLKAKKMKMMTIRGNMVSSLSYFYLSSNYYTMHVQKQMLQPCSLIFFIVFVFYQSIINMFEIILTIEVLYQTYDVLEHKVFHSQESNILTLICTETGFDVFDPTFLCSLEGHRILIWVSQKAWKCLRK